MVESSQQVDIATRVRRIRKRVRQISISCLFSGYRYDAAPICVKSAYTAFAKRQSKTILGKRPRQRSFVVFLSADECSPLNSVYCWKGTMIVSRGGSNVIPCQQLSASASCGELKVVQLESCSVTPGCTLLCCKLWADEWALQMIHSRLLITRSETMKLICQQVLLCLCW